MSDVIRGSARGTVWQTLSQLALAVAGYVVAVILARGLGPADFGTYGVIYSFLMAIEVIVLLGIPGAMSRLIAEGHDQNSAISSTALASVAVVCAIAFFALWTGAPQIARILGVADGTRLIRIAVLDVPCFGVYFLVSHILNGRRDFVGQSVGTFLYALSKVVGLIVLSWFGLTVAGAFVVNIITSIVGLLYVAWRVGRFNFVPTRASAKRIWSLTASIAAFALATQLMLGMDLWFLGALGDTSQATIGHYAAAKNLSRVPFFVASVMNAVLIPSIAYAAARGDAESVQQIVKGSMRFLTLTLIPGCALIATEARPLMSLLFSAEYRAGAPYLQLLVVANGLLQTLCSTMITILIAMRLQRIGCMVALAGIVPAIILNALLVPGFGAVGAGLAALGSAASAAILAGVVVYRHAGGLLESRVLVKIVAATASVCGLSAAFSTSGLLLIVKLMSLGVIFLVLSAALGLVTRADLAILNSRLEN